MLNEERVKLMTRMAAYEKKQGAQDFKISAYFRKDYAGWNVVWTLLWVSVGYVILVALAAVILFEKILEHLNFRDMFIMGAGVVIGYLLFLICYGIISSELYKERHDEARGRVKKFNRDLNLLMKLYKKERR